MLGMTCIVCNYGESLKSLDTWSKRWGWNKSKVRRFLSLCEELEQITVKNETKTTRITVLNYKEYDPKRIAHETQVKRKRNASETQATPDNNDNNVNNAKNVKKEQDRCPHDEIISIYNESLSEHLPKVIQKLWNGPRKKTLEARWKEDIERQNLPWWKCYFETVRASDFLTGKNDRGWKADMGWLINASNIVKVLEGTYKNNTKTNNGYKSKQQVNDEIQSIGANLNEKTRFNPYATIESGNSSGNVSQDKLTLPE